MKVCSKCKVEKDESEFGKDSRTKDGLKYKCTSCTRHDNSIDYHSNKDKYKAWAKRFKSNNPESIKETRTKYNIRNKEKISTLHKKHREDLSDSYVRNKISIDGIPPNQIPQELIDFHREVIRAKRLLKELQK